MLRVGCVYTSFFFLNDPAPTEIYPLPLHDALRSPAGAARRRRRTAAPRGGRRLVPLGDRGAAGRAVRRGRQLGPATADRKSTRLNSSHANISYAVFCLKKKIIPIKCKRPSA